MEDKPTIERIKWYEAEKVCGAAQKDQTKCITAAAEVIQLDPDMTCKFMQDSFKIDNNKIKLEKQKALVEGIKSIGKALGKAFTLGRKLKDTSILNEKCTLAPVADNPSNYGKIDMI